GYRGEPGSPGDSFVRRLTLFFPFTSLCQLLEIEHRPLEHRRAVERYLKNLLVGLWVANSLILLCAWLLCTDARNTSDTRAPKPSICDRAGACGKGFFILGEEFLTARKG